MQYWKSDAERITAVAEMIKSHIELLEDTIDSLRSTEAEVDTLETKAGKPPRPLAVSAGVEATFDLFFDERRRRNADVGRLYLHIEDCTGAERLGHYEKSGALGAFERSSAMNPAFVRLMEDRKKYEDMLKKINVQMLVFMPPRYLSKRNIRPLKLI